MGFKQLLTDGSIFVKDAPSKEFSEKVIVIVYVDDIIITSGNKRSVERTKHALLSCFEGTDEGKLSWYLGVKFERQDNTVAIS